MYWASYMYILLPSTCSPEQQREPVGLNVETEEPLDQEQGEEFPSRVEREDEEKEGKTEGGAEDLEVGEELHPMKHRNAT